MLWMILAAQLTAAQPVKYPSWFSHDDVPLALIAENTWRRVTVRAVVRPGGMLQKCEIERSSGDPKVDAHTCKLLLKRAHYTPARWSDGSPAYGIVRLPVLWSVGRRPPSDLPGDVEVTLSEIPSGEGSSITVGVVIAVDELGHAVSCAAEPAKAREPKPSSILYNLACERALSAYRAIPARDDNGRAVRSVQNAVVRFTARE
jgi:hypothetical protein